MATLKDGAIEIALNDAYVFTNVSNDDFIIRTTTSNQSIHIGTTSNMASAIQVAQTNVSMASNLYVANALAVGTSNTFSRLNVAGGINMEGGDLYRNNTLYLTNSNTVMSLFRVGAPIKQTFKPATTQSNFALTVNGDFSANVRDVDVYVNGAKLIYLGPSSNDYTIAETRTGLNTTFTVSVSYPVLANDLVDVTIWPSLSNFFSQNMLVLPNNVLPTLLSASNFNSNVLLITSNIGIGTATAPREALDIAVGNSRVASNLYVLNRLAIAHSNPQVSLDINTSTDAVALPRGTTAERPGAPVQGYMRYNTTMNTFEGYGPGNAWGSLGGVRDTNQDTYITPELVAGSNDDILRFYNSNSETMRINAQGNIGISNAAPSERLDVNGGNAKFSSNVYVLQRLAIAGSNPTESLDIATGNLKVSSNIYNMARHGVGTSNPTEPLDVLGNIKASSNVYVMARLAIASSNPTESLDIATGNLKVSSNVYAMARLAIASSNPTESLDIATGNLKVSSNVYAMARLAIASSNPTESLDIATGNLKVSSNVYAMARLAIASSNPTESLDIATGNLKVSSNVYAMARIAIASSNPTESLDIVGNVKASSNVYAMARLAIASSNPTEPLDVIGNVKASSNVYAMARLAIASSNPMEPLDVIGNVKASSNVYAMARLAIASSNPTESLDIVGNVKASSNVYAMARLAIASSNPTESLDVVGNVKASTNVYAMARHGVGTSNPTESVDVVGNVKASSNVYAMIRHGVGTSNPTESVDVVGNVKASSNVYAMARHGVGTSNPTESVDVVGNVKASFNVYAMARHGVGTSNPLESVDVVGNVKASSNVYAMTRHGVGTSNPTESVDVVGNVKASSNVYAMTRLGVGTSNPIVPFEVSGAAKIGGNLEVVGDLTIQGTTTTVNSTTVNIADNIIRLNNGAAYLTSLQAGIEVNRGGACNNYYFVLDEPSQFFKVGLQGALQIVATRDDTPAANSIAIYDATNKKFTGCNALAYNNGMLDVGTTIQVRPAANTNALQGLLTGMTAGQNINIALGQSTTSSNSALIRYTHQGANSAANAAQLGLAGFNHVTCQANGMVGINNTNPSNRLDVAGDMRLKHNQSLHLTLQDGSGTSTNALFMDFNNANSTARSIIGLDGTGFKNATAGALTMATWTNHDMLFLTNQTERMRITNIGNVGIKNNNPAYPLDVIGDINFTGSLLQNGSTFSGGWSSAGSNVSVPSTSYTIRVQYSTAGLQFFSDLDPANFPEFPGGRAFKQLLVSSGYNVSVTLNGALVRITGFLVDNPGGGAGGNETFATTRVSAVSSTETPVTSATYTSAGTDANVVAATIPVYSLGASLYTTSNNNVGIGTSNPTSKLDVIGKVYTSSQYLSTSNDSVTQPSFSFMEDSNTGMFHPANQSVGFATGGTERMRITNTGNVGIGMTPSYPLDVRVGTANAIVGRFSDPTTDLLINPGKRFGTNTAGWTSLDPSGGSTTTGVAFWDNVAVAGGMAIGTDSTYGQATIPSGNLVTSGNIGVGTMSPASRLDVVGGVRVSHTSASHITCINGSTGPSNAVFMDLYNSDSTARAIIGLDGTGYSDTSRGSLTLSTWTNHNMIFATNQAERMRMTSNGNLGIGTINPQSRLDVVGRLRVSHNQSLQMTITDTSGTSTNSLFMDFNNANTTARGLIGLDGTGYVNSSAGALTMATWTNHNMVFATNQAERMRMTSNGNLGIGTINPQYMLDVSGTTRISGNRLYLEDGGVNSGLFIDRQFGLYGCMISANGYFNGSLLRQKGAAGVVQLDMHNGGNSGDLPYFNFAGTGGSGTDNSAVSLSNWMRLDGTGLNVYGSQTVSNNLGIGTNNPQYRLHVAGGAAYFPDGIINPGIQAQWSMSGGGTVTWASNKLLWSQRVVLIPVERSEFGNAGYIDISCPTSGTITLYTSSDTVGTQACDAGGILMDNWYSLYYEVTPGQSSTSDATKFRLVHYNNTSWRPSTNWILIACTNLDSQNLKWIPGSAYITSGSTFTTTGSGGGGGGGVGWYASGANIVSMSNVGVGIVPTTRFHVGGAATTLDGSTTGDHRVIICKQNAANVGSVLFTQGGNTGTQGFAEIGLAGDNSMSFKVNATAGNYSTRMYMTASNIGINNTAPLELLHITGKIYADSQHLSSAANDSVTVPSYTFREDSNTGIFHPATSTLGFTTAGVERARIGTSGIGINTILTPTCTLDINGNLCVKSTTIPEVRFINSNNNQQCVIAMATNNGQYSTSAITNDLIIRTDIATSRLHLQVTSQSAAITVNSNNFIGINTTNPTYRLHVNGDIFATGDILAFSDSNLKTDIVPISKALQKVTTLNGYTYKRIDQPLDSQRQAGLLAQDVQKVLPEVVHIDPGTSNLSIAYGNMAALFVEAFKDMRKEIDDLKGRLEEINQRIR